MLFRWEVERRFSELVSFAEWITTTFPDITLPDFPSKLALFKMKETVALERRTAIELYLDFLVRRYPYVTYTFEFSEFFKLHSRLKKMVKTEGLKGSLYLKIVDVTIPIQDSQACRCYAKIYQTQPISKDVKPSLINLITPVSEHPTQPIWNQEMVMFLESRKNPIRIHLWNKSASFLRSNKSLGFVDLDICKLTPKTLLLLHLPLLGSPWDDATIQVHAYFSSKEFQYPICQTLPFFRLELYRTLFTVGEPIKGRIILNIGNPIPIKSIKLSLNGIVSTVDERHEEQEVVLRDTFFSKKHTLFNYPEAIRDGGTYTFPFNLHYMSEDKIVPPSFKSDIGLLGYILSLIIKKENGEKETKHCPITLLPAPGVPREVAFLWKIQIPKPKPVTMEITSSESTFIIGQEQPFTIKIGEYHGTIVNCLVQLYQRITCYDARGTRVISKRTKLICEDNTHVQNIITMPGWFIYQSFIKFDDNLEPSLPLESNHGLEVSYVLKVHATFESMNIKTFAPLVLIRDPDIENDFTGIIDHEPTV